MHIRAVVDKKGKIVSVAFPDPEENEQEPTLRSGPVLEEGEEEVELDVLDAYRGMTPGALVQQVQMEIGKKGRSK